MNSGQGTRQITTVTSEEGGPSEVKGLAPVVTEGRSEMGVATVYQKHRTLQTHEEEV